MYLTYEEYQNIGGTLESASFEDLEFEAEMLINKYTYNRFKNDLKIPEEVKKCLMKIISMLAIKQKSLTVGNQESGIASQSNDGVSISYNVLSASEAITIMETQIKDVISMYLNGIKNEAGRLVLYKGLYPNE